MTAPSNRDYVEVVYDEGSRPLTSYPEALARHLFTKFGLKRECTLLDVGCGRGEFLQGFIRCGVSGYGVDRSSVALRYCTEATFKTCDLESEYLPYDDGFFDVVYSKSVIEHFYYPERLIQEMHRVLKPGGLLITLCPDWEANYRIYYEDYTHRTPFTLSSLRDIQLIHGFENVAVSRFRQLPVLWNGGRWLLPLAELTRFFVPDMLKSYSKWIRFSKEIMLLASANKPRR